MRFKEALKFALLNGKNSTDIRQRISNRLWGKSSKVTQDVNVSNLVRGKTVSFKENYIVSVCEETGVSPNFLFGYNEETKTFQHE